MQIQCDCGQFEAKLLKFPTNSPGRLVCYCADCQEYLRKLGREDLLDAYGGTQIIPVYPREMVFHKGTETLQCNRLKPSGLDRWSTSCCNSPIANSRPGFPWVGVLHNAYTARDPAILETLGPIRSRIQGRDASGEPPFRVSEKLAIRDVLVVLPFLLKGAALRKARLSPFFKEDDKTPITEPRIL